MLQETLPSLSLLKLLLEGAFVDFDKSGQAKSVSIDTKTIPGEQLHYTPRSRRYNTYGVRYNVYYSLSTAEDAKAPKQAQDVLKRGGVNINKSELEAIILATFKDLNVPYTKFTHIFTLGSSDNLVNLLGEAAASICDAELVQVPKMQYKFIDNAVDWKKYQQQTEKIKRAVDDYLEKRASTEQSPFSVSKTGLRGAISKAFYSKYDMGFNPYEKGNVGDRVNSILHQAVLGSNGVRVLIVDDNIHSGEDFSKIFKGVNDIYQGIKTQFDSYAKTGKATLTAPHLSHNERIAGYVLYRLEDVDINKTKEVETGQQKRKPTEIKTEKLIQKVLNWYQNHPEPTWKAQTKFVQKKLTDLSKAVPVFVKFEQEVERQYPKVFSDTSYKDTYGVLRKT